MINRVILTGRLARDPELRKTQSGLSVCSFQLAVDRPKLKGQDEAVTDWISCQAWNKTAEYIGNYAKKGTLIGVDGRIQTRNYDNASGQKVYVTEVVCESVSLLSAYGNRNITPDTDPRTAGYACAQNAMSGYDYSSDPTLEISSDDLPF